MATSLHDLCQGGTCHHHPKGPLDSTRPGVGLFLPPHLRSGLQAQHNLKAQLAVLEGWGCSWMGGSFPAE